jgi:hypothetical protein
MKCIVISLTIWILNLPSGFGQGTAAAQHLKEQAAKMGTALLSKDLKTFGKYINPHILELMGGQENMEKGLNLSLDNMKQQQISFKSINFGEPSAFVKSGNELQCTIPQNTEISTPKGITKSKSTLIAISADEGKTWTFVDTSNKDINTLRKILPNLSHAIKVAPMQAPSFSN